MTFPVGYGTLRKSRAELLVWPSFAKLHPEVQRRALAMMDDAAKAGHDLGIGTGWRSSQVQLAVFLERHTVVASGGCCGYNGKRYQLRKGYAHAAPPGRSWHEDAAELGGYAVAIDWVGWQDGWMNAHCHLYGLKHFASSATGSEPWHTQPVEFPNSRSKWTPNITMTAWKLPGDTPADTPKPTPPPPVEDNDMAAALVHVNDGDSAVFAVANGLARWVTGAQLGALKLTGQVQADSDVAAPRDYLRSLVLVGPAPVYPVGYSGPVTTAADFGAAA